MSRFLGGARPNYFPYKPSLLKRIIVNIIVFQKIQGYIILSSVQEIWFYIILDD